jgi:hypothetical protein
MGVRDVTALYLAVLVGNKGGANNMCGVWDTSMGETVDME